MAAQRTDQCQFGKAVDAAKAASALGLQQAAQLAWLGTQRVLITGESGDFQHGTIRRSTSEQLLPPNPKKLSSTAPPCQGCALRRGAMRSEKRRVGKAGVRTRKSRWTTYQLKKHKLIEKQSTT